MLNQWLRSSTNETCNLIPVEWKYRGKSKEEKSAQPMTEKFHKWNLYLNSLAIEVSRKVKGGKECSTIDLEVPQMKDYGLHGVLLFVDIVLSSK